jgi:tripartite ATP-independent transporter DctP family solute receptor
LLVALASLGLIACGAAGRDGKVWRFAIEEIEGSVQHLYATRFRTLVEERTAGEVSVEIYPYGSLGTSAQITEQVQSGALQLAFASPGHLGSVIPEVQVFSLHFLLADDERVNQAVLTGDGEARRLLEEAYRERRLELLDIVPEGWMVWTANRPLHAPADFDGLKIRTMVSPLLVEAYSAYGADPTPMPYAEVYGGLQLHMIDAQVNPVFAIEEMSFYEVQDYMIFANHAPFVTTLVASPGFIASLAPGRRAVLEGVIAELDGYIFDAQRRLNADRLAKIEAEGGTQILTLDSAERRRFRDLSRPVRRTYVEMAGPRGQAILDALSREVREAERSADS